MSTILSQGIPSVTLDVDKLIATRGLVTSNSGGGKSWLLRKIAEICASKVQVFVIDPDGEFVTLREKFDFALVGNKGDIEIDIPSAPVLAKKLLEYRIPAIINVSDIDELNKKREYVAAFINGLMSVSRAHWHPVLILIDEAHRFCPEKGDVPSSTPIITLMDSGRKRGFAGILATQRLSKLNKDAAAEGGNVFIGRTWLDNDRERAGDLLGIGKRETTILRDLDPGEFYAFGAALKHSQNGIVKFKSGQVVTTHPEAGKKHLSDVPATSDSIAKVVTHLRDLPKRVIEEKITEESMRRTISELERRLRDAEKTQAIGEIIETVVEVKGVESLKNGLVNLEDALGKFDDAKGSLNMLAMDINKAVEEANSAIARLMAITRDRSSKSNSHPKPATNNSLFDSQAGKVPTGDRVPMSKPQRNILNAMSSLLLRGVGMQSRNLVAFLSGQSPKSSGYSSNLRALKNSGLIEYSSSSTIRLTEQGEAISSPFDIGESTIQAAIMAKVSRPQALMIAHIIKNGKNKVYREELALASGQSFTSSGYASNLRALKSLGLIEYSTSDTVVASDILYL